MRKNVERKGFTTVELVIVIAVIAVLATVLIPTFSGLVTKANDSKAIQQARNAYTEYLIDNNGSAPAVMLYQDGERWVALKNGVPEGVYATQDEALAAVVDSPDENQLTPTANGKLFAYGGEVGDGGNAGNNGGNSGDNTKERLAGKKISFMGDSITTYSNWSNNTTYNTTIGNNRIYYDRSDTSGLLASVNETWWKKTVDKLGLELCVNNSYSGSRVASGGSYPDEVGCGEKRTVNLHNDNTNAYPDIIVVYMGTNDYQEQVDVGTFATAYAQMVERIQGTYPDADIYLCTLHNYDYVTAGFSIAPSAYNEKIRAVATAKNYTVIDFYNGTGVNPDNIEEYTIDRQVSSSDISLVHPNAAGMAKMYECVKSALAQNYQIDENRETYTVTVNKDYYVSVGNYSAEITEGESFEMTLTGYNVNVTVTMGGQEVDCYANGKITIGSVDGNIVIEAESGYDWMEYFNEVSTEAYSGTTNLFDPNSLTLRDGYYNQNNDWEGRADLKSAIIPVSEGMVLKASSFAHGSSGTRITWLMADGTMQTVNGADVFAVKDTGLVVPEGVIAVCMVWRFNCANACCSSNYLYITLPNQN